MPPPGSSPALHHHALHAPLDFLFTHKSKRGIRLCSQSRVEERTRSDTTTSRPRLTSILRSLKPKISSLPNLAYKIPEQVKHGRSDHEIGTSVKRLPSLARIITQRASTLVVELNVSALNTYRYRSNRNVKASLPKVKTKSVGSGTDLSKERLGLAKTQ